jgi:hypothetical protein
MKIFLVLESACTDEVNGLNKPISYVSGAILRQNIQKKQFLLPFIHFKRPAGLLLQPLTKHGCHPFSAAPLLSTYVRMAHTAYLCTLLR